ncbi:MAG: formylglycine-generating enzyme family protein [Myxococcales bacterium]|nr:MAG: formylglycine-generating enzyme family protein [Myxococcales bacterium]
MTVENNRNTPRLVKTIAVVLAATAILVVLVNFSVMETENPPAPLAPAAPPAPAPPPADLGLNWVPVPGGTFQMGSNSGITDEKPVHAVTVSSFELAKAETTGADYEACVKAGACAPAGGGAYCNAGQPERRLHPINCVTFPQAQAFCAWVGGRLPTEAEWERAARGDDGRLYPWGPEPATCERAVIDEGGPGCGEHGTKPVCSRPKGDAPGGLCDMAGNVWEWTADRYLKTYYAVSPAVDPKGPEEGEETKGRALRSGSWTNTPEWVRAVDRDRNDEREPLNNLGFRCARDVRPPAPAGAAP